MKIVMEAISGTLLSDGQNTALRLNLSDPEGEAAVYLAYALVTQGPEYQLLPSMLLDDWGNEIGHLALYQWIRDNTLHFPRAEVFGSTPSGAPEQYFLRDIELFTKYPTYAFSAEDAPISSGVPLQAALIPDEAAESPTPVSPPDHINGPLREARVSWWRVNPRQVELGFISVPFAPE